MCTLTTLTPWSPWPPWPPWWRQLNLDLQDGLLHDGGSLPSRGTWVVGRWMLWFDKVAALPPVQCISLSRLRDGRGGAGFKIHRAQWGRRNSCREEVDKTDHIIIPNKDALSSDQIFEFTLKSLDPSGHVLPATLGPTPIQLEPALYL